MTNSATNPPAQPQGSVSAPKTGSSRTAASAKKTQKSRLTGFMLLWFRQYHKQVAIAACVILFIFAYLTVLGPKLAASRAIANQGVERAQGTRSRLSQQLAYLAKLETASAGVPASAATGLDNMLPNEPNTPQILTSLENIAQSSGVLINGIDLVIPEDEVADKIVAETGLPSGVRYVEVTLSIAASPYEQLKTLLENIEANIRLMDVIAVVYAPSGKSYTITLRAYYLAN